MCLSSAFTAGLAATLAAGSGAFSAATASGAGSGLAGADLVFSASGFVGLATTTGFSGLQT